MSDDDAPAPQNDSPREALLRVDWCRVPGGDVEIVRTRYDNPAQETGLRIRHLRRNLEPFSISRHPVSNAQFQAFIDAQGGYFDRRWWNFSSRAMQARRPQPPALNALPPDAPVTRVAWYDAIAFCRWLSHHLQQTISIPDEFRWQHAAARAARVGLAGIGMVEEWCLAEGPEDEQRDHLATRGGPWSSDPVHVRRELNPLALEPDLGFRLLLVADRPPPPDSAPASVDMDEMFLMMERIVNPRHTLETRLETVRHLGQTRDPRAAEQLLEYLEKLLPSSEPGDPMPLTIVESLRGYYDATLAGPLIRALKTRDPALRAAAARALADYPEAHVVQQLVIALRDDEAHVRDAAADALLDGNKASIIAAMMRVWQQTDSVSERAALVDVLARFEHPDAATALRHIARNDADAGVRARAQTCVANHPHAPGE